ncbi:MAG: family 78 glycoside hydrolase catalytic domain [Oscillospiraceae bacterium]|nr:family 78 glycoside hydrolase catalytic domain [Oscillospiraceae bacterium]
MADMTERGTWLTVPIREERPQLLYFRHEFDASSLAGTFRLSADSRYKLFCNGALVQSGPCKGDDKVWYDDDVSLKEILLPGTNVLAVEILWPGNDPWNSNHSLFTMGRPALYVEGIRTQGWRCHTVDTIFFPAEEEGFAPLHIHEQASLGPNTIGWKQPGFDDSGWTEAKAIPPEELPESRRPDRLRPRAIPQMALIPHSFELQDFAVPANSEKELVLDAGEEMCAYLRLRLSGGRGAKIELLQSECYTTESGKQNRLDSEHGVLEGYTDSYTVTGLADACYEPFWFRTFHFLRLRVKTEAEPLRICAIDYTETGYPLEVKTRLTTSDKSLADIWDISLRTLKRCMHDTYMDCPFYEQLQYAMDTRAEILYTYAISADDRPARQAIDDFSRAQRPDGLLNCSYPNKNANVIPGFSIYWILMLHDHMMYFGDKAFLTRYLPTVTRILDFFHSHRNAVGVVDKLGGENGKAAIWSFIDWAESWMPTTGMPDAGLHGPITMESLLVLLGLQKAAELTEYLEKPEMASEWRTRAERLQQAIRACCLDDSGMLTDGPGRTEISQHAQVFGILTGTLSREEGRRNLLRTMEERGITQCSVAMCFYLFRALEETGLYEYTDRYWDIWRRMVDNGCTTCVEAENYARSECHAWGALALYELPSVTLGVRPAAPGYEQIEVRPQPGVLTSASGTVHTPRGDVSVAWEKNGAGLKLEISCDAEMKRRIKSEIETKTAK